MHAKANCQSKREQLLRSGGQRHRSFLRQQDLGLDLLLIFLTIIKN
jgi:hypothetical protein